MLALIVLRYKPPYKDKHRPYKVHISIPIAVFIISIYLVVCPIIEDPRVEYLYVTMYILVGFFVYLLFVKYKFRCNTVVG